MTVVKRISAALVVFAVLCLSAGCGAGTPSPGAGRKYTFVAPGGQDRLLYDPPETRGQVTGLSGPDLVDPASTLRLEQFAGQVVVLNVWGSWCGPCRLEVPDLQELHRTQGPQGVTVLGIDVRDDRDAARDFLTSRSVSYPNIFDPAGRSLLALAGFPRNTTPSTVVLDRSHRVAAVFLRAVRIGELVPIVQRLTAEPPQSATGGTG